MVRYGSAASGGRIERLNEKPTRSERRGNIIAHMGASGLKAVAFNSGTPVEHHKLDSIDMRILAELQADGRITNVETVAPRQDHRSALSKAYAGAGKGRLHPRLPRRSRRQIARLRSGPASSTSDWPANTITTSNNSRSICAPGRKCASATCSRARWISSSNAWPKDLASFQDFITVKFDRGEKRCQRETALAIHASKFQPGVPLEIKS